jgi:hypothetical protein
MTFFGMALITAIATVVLAVFAVFTAVYARKAFREQSREVAAIEQQLEDQRVAPTWTTAAPSCGSPTQQQLSLSIGTLRNIKVTTRHRQS